VAILSGMCAVLGGSPAASATDPCGAGGNKISCENSKPGSPASEWDILGSGDEDNGGLVASHGTSVHRGNRNGRICPCPELVPRCLHPWSAEALALRHTKCGLKPTIRMTYPNLPPGLSHQDR